MEIFKFLKDYPEIGTLAIATIFSALGFFGQSIMNFFLEKSKKKVEFRELLWKEKIQSAKKASEYYKLHMGFISLTAEQYEMYEENNSGAEELIKSTQVIIDNYKKKLLDFPHFEHYHISLFYDLDESYADEIVKDNYRCFQSIGSVNFDVTDSEEELDSKMNVLKENFGILKENHKKIIDIYNGYIKMIREDIKKLPL